MYQEWTTEQDQSERDDAAAYVPADTNRGHECP